MQKNDVFSQPRTFLQSHKSTVYLIVRVVMRSLFLHSKRHRRRNCQACVHTFIKKSTVFVLIRRTRITLSHLRAKNAADNFNYDTIRDATLTCAQKLT